MNPLVSVVIPVFNQERFLAEAIESVLAQTYPSIETVVVDDGSTDGTSAVARGYGSRIVYLRQDNAGAAAALNRGIQQASGDLVGWLSSDDVYLPTKIERQVELHNRRPEIAATYTDFMLIGANGEVIRKVKSRYLDDRRKFIRQLILVNFVNGSSILARKDALIEAGLFDTQMKYHADGNMWLRLLKRGEFGQVPEVLLKYRIHAGAASRDRVGMERYRQIYFDKIWETFAVDEVVLDGEDPEQFMTRALISNGLYGRAWKRLANGRGRPTLFLDFVKTWSADLVRRRLR
jgi:glycosyltransferase involved in cell wall biosynthesis